LKGFSVERGNKGGRGKGEIEKRTGPIRTSAKRRIVRSGGNERTDEDVVGAC